MPTITEVVRLDETSAKVIWVPLTADEARGVLTELDIAYQPAINGSCARFGDSMELMTIEQQLETQSEAVLDDLEPEEEYCVAMQVSTIAGESGFSNVVKAQRKHNPIFMAREISFFTTVCELSPWLCLQIAARFKLMTFFTHQ